MTDFEHACQLVLASRVTWFALGAVLMLCWREAAWRREAAALNHGEYYYDYLTGATHWRWKRLYDVEDETEEHSHA